FGHTHLLSPLWDHGPRMVGGGQVSRRRAEPVPVQARLGELDDMLVAMRNGALDKLLGIRCERPDVFHHRSLPAKAGIKRAPGLPGISNSSVRGPIADVERDVA